MRGAEQVSVHDYGPPIPAKSLPHLFEPFRGVESDKLQGKRQGLGLFIVREIIRSHGGELSLRSEVGYGTTFSFTLPRGQAPCGGP